MNELYPTYTEYAAFGGTLEEDGFLAVLSPAFARVKARCCSVNLDWLSDEELDAFKGAVCAAIDALSDDSAGRQSYSAGKVSETFSASSVRASSVEAAIERQLSGTRLIETGLL